MFLLILLEEGGIQLVPDGTLIIHVLAIVIMVFLLNATLFKPINEVLEAREKRGKGRFDEAGEILERVTGKLSAYESGLRAARSEAYQLLESEHAAARAEREGKVASVRQELADSTSAEKQELARQAEAARKALEANAQQFAHEVGTRILGRTV
ncbi:MAG: synthase [Blastocatellia bacterium]|jgi:F-type H+-transporting ATPase subunit b|nr:synthase [Blastocatellia bacterium]